MFHLVEHLVHGHLLAKQVERAGRTDGRALHAAFAGQLPVDAHPVIGTNDHVHRPLEAGGSQFTALFERLAIDLLRECSITGAMRLLDIS